MSSDWQKVELSKLVNFQTGKLDSNAAEENGTYPFFTCSPTTLTINSYAFDCEAVLLAGNNASGIFPVKYFNGKFNAYQRTYVITPIDKQVVNPQWLYFRIQFVTNELQQMSVGTATKFLTKKILDAYEVALPSYEEQTRIADILWSIQNKIELNRQTNQTLEQIAQTLFKSWFVDFEPTRAKIAAKEAGASPEEIERVAMCVISGKTPDQLAQLPAETQQNLQTTAALFPDALVDSELGEIPEGWEILPLDGIAEIIMGQSPNGDSYNENGEGELLINGPVEFGEYHPKKIKWTTSPTKFSDDKDLIVCVRGSTTGRYVKSDGKYCLGRGVCAIRSKNNQQAFVDQLFKHCLEKLLTHATGSTFPSWNGPVLKNYKVNAAISELSANYSSLVQEFEDQISLNAVSIQDLSNLRDALLPKLLSGELAI
ncbi:restriction endonuclease subunit S [Undibacterium flavidum]|uniref:Restriction endonuclease subunit S n=1 Tax=Undibacterium flavidum TaxID=2762297 RepID=A0ABR6YG23_9BURK|nr:restriction endonuclease subunit S [Undibacterium flavidum]MBC3875521.1 restriction endonuclease subunit S [Undibacterium flavidum]